jgi:aminoglycoside phosphotransferase (APT) family kinase protein
VNRVWVGDELVVRLSDGQLRDSFLHEARVVGLLTGTAVPHARCIGTGTGPDGTWYISERVPGRTLHQVWNELTPTDRREVVTALGEAIRALHRVAVPVDLKPAWLSDAVTFEPRSTDHARIEAVWWLDELAAVLPGMDRGLITSAHSWMSERRDLFVGDGRVLVHADLHPSNVMVDGTTISGLIDFEVARAQPPDAELHRLLFWCARGPNRTRRSKTAHKRSARIRRMIGAPDARLARTRDRHICAPPPSPLPRMYADLHAQYECPD